MTEKQLQVHVFRIRSLKNYKYIDKAQILLNEVEKKDEEWKAKCTYETIKDYYILKSEIAESWMNYTESIRIIQELLIPLTKDNEKDKLHIEYLFAKANCFGNRKIRAYYLLNDITENSSHSVEDRILSHINLAWILNTISSNNAIDEHILSARKLIGDNKEYLHDDSQYYELLCQFEECRKYQKFRFDYKLNKSLKNIINQSFKILEQKYDERYYQLIFDILYMMSNSITGCRDYQNIKLNLKSPHYWNLFDCYYQNISIGFIRPILGIVDHCPKEKLACVMYYLAPLIIGGKNPQLIATILQIGQMAVTQHPDESVLDIMSSVRECSLFAIDYLVLPFYKAQKELAKNVYRERGIYEEPNKCFLLLEDIRNIFNLSAIGQEVIESRECDIFLNHHIKNPGILEDTLDFFSLKLNVDTSLTTPTRLKKDLDFINTFCLEDDDDTLPTRIQFHNDTISNIFVIGTQNLKINRQEAALVFEVIFQSLRKVFEKLKNCKIVDKEFFNLVDIGVSMMIEKLRYVPELCQHLVVLLYDIKIHNNQIAIDSNFYESFELEVFI